MLTRRQFFAASGTVAALAAAPPPIPRRDCFFGLHFDLHPNPTDKALGRDLTPAMADRLLREVRPDYIQYDCKGHVGYLGYPSQVSTAAPNIVQDSLAIWRQATMRQNVGLFIHFSGVWDSLAIEQHPEWATILANGDRDPNATSTFSPYVDERMIPQLKEVFGKYNLDGAWIDGECWSVKPDYSPAAAEAFRQATGRTTLPKGPEDAGWQEFLEFHRTRFRSYLRHYLDELHRWRPGVQIASNWMYTTFVPERPEIGVDFVSGDYLGNASISTARLESRYLSAIDKPWDLMAWGFQHNPKSDTVMSHKTAVQLQQEAAVVLAQGGGFQIYYTPTRAGYIDDRHVRVMRDVARFCRARQGVSHQTEAVPGIGVLFSTTSLYTRANKLFGGWGSHTNPARGMVDALTASQYSVDVIPEWKLAEVAARYPMIVLPDWPNVGQTVRDRLLAYAREGGTLLVVGAENVQLFQDALGVRLEGSAAKRDAFVPGDEVFGNVSGIWQDVQLAGARAIGSRYPTFDGTRDAGIAATVQTVGKGRVAAVYGPLGKVFAANHAAPVRQFLREVVKPLYRPALEVKAPPVVEVAVRRKAGQTLVHLLNTAQMQVAAEYAVLDYIPAVGPVEISLALPERPRGVRLEPAGISVNGTYANGRWKGTVERVGIHEVLVFS